MDLTVRVKKYAQKFKGFDERVVDGVSLCYKHSPTFRKHVESPHFGEVRGWRITWLWTPHVKEYETLKLIGPLDLGIYSVRIDGILGETNIPKFVQEAKGKPIFREYIKATADFISELIGKERISWQSETNPPIETALKLCGEVSPTLNRIMAKGKGDGWEIVNLWVDNSEKIEALRNIYPLDIAIYCVRLDSITYGIDLTDFGKAAAKIPAFKLFPREVVRFILQVLRRNSSERYSNA